MKQYLLKFQPLAPFYFGSERNFGTGEDTDYFACSRQAPQQTTLLGALRFKMLEAADELSPEYGGPLRPEAVSWVGSKSFEATQPQKKNIFGKIGGISPLFLLDGEGKHLLPGGLDGYDDQNFQLVVERNKSAFVKISEEKTVLKEDLPRFQNYNIKRWRVPFWVCEDGTTRKTEDIFQEIHQVGVFKLHGRGKESREKFLSEDEQKGFFKKISWSFHDKKTCFACGAWLTEDAVENLSKFLKQGNNGITEIGGERSPFHISLDEVPSGWPASWTSKTFFRADNHPDMVKIVLISDALADMKLYQLANHACVELTDFRNIRTSNMTDNYFKMDKKYMGGTSIAKSGKLNLLAAGSVFYVPNVNLAKFRAELTGAEAFRQIGYNHFMEISKDKVISFFKP